MRLNRTINYFKATSMRIQTNPSTAEYVKSKSSLRRPPHNWVSACKATSTADVLPVEQPVRYESTLAHFLNTSDKNCQETPSTFLEQPSLISNKITLPFYSFTKKQWAIFPPQITNYLLNLKYNSFCAFTSTSQHYQPNCES